MNRLASKISRDSQKSDLKEKIGELIKNKMSSKGMAVVAEKAKKLNMSLSLENDEPVQTINSQPENA